MTSRTFSDLKADVLALCGLPDENTQEGARIERFLNMRARKAYAMSENWPRFLVRGEERITSEDGLVPYAQDGLQTIGTVRRIHATDPFRTEAAGEYISYAAVSDGIQIAGYQPALISEGAPMLVEAGDGGSYVLIPDVSGTYEMTDSVSTGAFGTTLPIYRNTENHNYTLTPQIVETTPDSATFAWRLVGSATQYWDTAFSADYTSPELPPAYTEQGSAFGEPIVTKIATYSCYVTYKAAFSEEYEDEEDVPEEWSEYMVRGALADWLRSEARTEEAVVAEAEARDFIEDQLCKISSQNGSDVITRVVTHGNTQCR